MVEFKKEIVDLMRKEVGNTNMRFTYANDRINKLEEQVEDLLVDKEYLEKHSIYADSRIEWLEETVVNLVKAHNKLYKRVDALQKAAVGEILKTNVRLGGRTIVSSFKIAHRDD